MLKGAKTIIKLFTSYVLAYHSSFLTPNTEAKFRRGHVHWSVNTGDMTCQFLAKRRGAV